MAGVVELEAVACPLCGAARDTVLLESVDLMHHIAGNFRVVRCEACRHRYMNPGPTAATILNGYPTGYGPHASAQPDAAATPGTATPSASPAPVSAARPWYLHPAVRRIPGLRGLYYWLTDTRGDFVPSPASGASRALELGCATGTFLSKLRSAGWTAQGVEPVASAAEVARRQGFEVHVGTLESAGFPDAAFDATFGWMVIEHLIDPRAALQEMARITRPGGWIGISIPNIGCWEPKVFRRYWYLWEFPRHLHFFTPRSIRRLVEECGFEQVRVMHQRNALNLIGSLGLWLRKRFPQSRLAERILTWPDHPTTWPQLALAPLAIILAAVRQGGRLTLIARRSAATMPPHPGSAP